MKICSNLGWIRMLLAVWCGLAVNTGCEDSDSDPARKIYSDKIRRQIEQTFRSNLAMHPANTTTAVGIGQPLRHTPTRSQWGLHNQLQPEISIQWQLNLVDQAEPVRIAIIDESFDVDALGLKHAFDEDAGVNLLHPGAPLWTAHRNGFHHGNLVASIIANRPVGERSPMGVLGPSDVELIPIVAAGGDGPSWRTPRATPSMILEALRHAVEQGAEIINISAGMDVSSDELNELAADPVWNVLEENGIPVVCAAGNEGRNIDEQPLFPASIDRPNVIAVMGVGPEGRLAIRRDEVTGNYLPASNWGPNTVDCAAPGEIVEVEARVDQPQLVDGTSAAAAFVTAVMAVQPSPGRQILPEISSLDPKAALIRFSEPSASED